MAQTPAPARRAAHDAIRAVHTGRCDLATAIDRARRPLADPRDRALAGDIAFGVCRWRAALDHLIAQASTRPVRAIAPAVQDLLRAAVYQIRWLDRVPAHAAVADAVALTTACAPRAAGFVNAVLRVLADRRRPITLPPAPAPAAAVSGGAAGTAGDPPDGRRAALDHLAITLSHPRWLAARWLDRYGLRAATAWARFDNRPAPITLRAHLARNDAAELAAVLAAHGVETTPSRAAPHGLVVTRGHPLTTPAAAEGRFVVQSAAAQLVVELARPAPGRRVLDLCAAPGGKTVGLADGVGPGGVVVAADRRPRRVALLARTVARSRLTRTAIVRLDAAAPLPFGAVFDDVLLDAPCSGLGMLRRDPDIRWRRTAADLPGFAAVQGRMLRRAADAVRPGGRLVYAVCSIEPEETDAVVARFLDRDARFRRAAPDAAPALAGRLDPDGALRTLPFRDDLDAFFGVVLIRRAA